MSVGAIPFTVAACVNIWGNTSNSTEWLEGHGMSSWGDFSVSEIISTQRYSQAVAILIGHLFSLPQMELVKTQQVNRYIAAQGPMQHTCRDYWQVRDIRDIILILLTDHM